LTSSNAELTEDVSLNEFFPGDLGAVPEERNEFDQLVYAAKRFDRDELEEFGLCIVAQAIAAQVEMQAYILFAYIKTA
jgi:hypothetical protein